MNTAAIDLPAGLTACESGAFHVEKSVVVLAQAARSVKPIANAVTGFSRNIATPFVRAARAGHANARAWAEIPTVSSSRPRG
jgi:hypothetical protein